MNTLKIYLELAKHKSRPAKKNDPMKLNLKISLKNLPPKKPLTQFEIDRYAIDNPNEKIFSKTPHPSPLARKHIIYEDGSASLVK